MDRTRVCFTMLVWTSTEALTHHLQVLTEVQRQPTPCLVKQLHMFCARRKARPKVPFSLHGDPAYPNHSNLMYPGHHIVEQFEIQEQQAFNMRVFVTLSQILLLLISPKKKRNLHHNCYYRYFTKVLLWYSQQSSQRNQFYSFWHLLNLSLCTFY